MEGNGLAQIVTALEIIHRSSTSNQQRHEAQGFLENVQSSEDAPYWGWQLATPKSNNPEIVKHFGLSLLQHAIQYNFITYDEPRQLAVRNWVVDLATSVTAQDPHFLKEKLAYLWVAIAKRVWGLETDRPYKNDNGSENGAGNVGDGWIEMDSVLVQMWNSNSATRELTLSILRTLFEDLYLLDDAIASKRAPMLSAQCIEIVTSEDILEATYESRTQSLRRLRQGSEGWINRWSQLLGECLAQAQGPNGDPSYETFAVKILQTLKTCLYWAFPSAIRQANLLNHLSVSLTSNNIKIKTLASDCLHVLFTRTFNNDEEFQAIVGAVFLPSGMETLSQVFDSIHIDPDNFDERAYLFLKKLVEMIVGLGEYLNISKTRLPKEADIGAYLRLVLKTTKHPSLVISGLSLQFWCSVLRVEKITGKEELDQLLPDLLEVAADRCIKYEDVGETHISRRFLDIDFDSTPESHVFLGNYRRFMEDTVRLIVCKIPLDAMPWLKTRMEQFFSSDLGWQSLNVGKLSYHGNPHYFLAYSQFILVEAALRGVNRWKLWYNEPDKEEIAVRLSQIVEDWGEKLIMMNVQDPLLLRKLVQTLVQFAPLLKNISQLMFRVLEKVLTACTFDYPPDANDEDLELIRDLRTNCGTELNRLAYMMPEALMEIYDDLEKVIGDIIASDKLSDHETVAFRSFLLVVSQRSKVPNKVEKFSKIVDPVLQSWSDEATIKGLMDLPWFMERVGIVRIAEYFRARGVTAETDLLQTNMDEAGRALKADLKKTWSALFPIRATRIFIQYTIEKLDHSSKEYTSLLTLWKPRIQPILPHILQLVAQIQAYHNPNNWTNLPPEVQTFVKYSCMERFWQVGVSTQTRDQFVDENVKAMHTLRDFADSVGHIIRYTREYAFLTLGSISQLEETMYEIPGMASNLWLALAGDSEGITLHSWKHMISLVLRNVIKNCPVHLIQPFMKEFLPPVLVKLDQILTDKWEKIYRTGVQLMGDEEEDETSLSEEMMEEHLLRQLTAIVDRMLIDLVGQLGGTNSSKTSAGELLNTASTTEKSDAAPNGTVLTPPIVLRDTVLGTKEILAPFLTLCTHIMKFKDNRCSFNCCLIVRNILPSILLQDIEVDTFLCDNLIKTCLDILNDQYFSDVHNEAGYVLTTVYTVLRTQYQRPLEALSSLLANVSPEALNEFEARLAVTKSLRQQRGVFMEFLALVRAVAKDDNGHLAARERMQKKMERKAEKGRWLTKKNTQGGDLMEQEGFEPSAIATLFGDEDL